MNMKTRSCAKSSAESVNEAETWTTSPCRLMCSTGLVRPVCKSLQHHYLWIFVPATRPCNVEGFSFSETEIMMIVQEMPSQSVRLMRGHRLLQKHFLEISNRRFVKRKRENTRPNRWHHDKALTIVVHECHGSMVRQRVLWLFLDPDVRVAQARRTPAKSSLVKKMLRGSRSTWRACE